MRGKYKDKNISLNRKGFSQLLDIKKLKMDFSKEHSEFLASYQRLVFNPKLQGGTPRERADLLRNILAQLQFAKSSGILDDESAATMSKDYWDMYTAIVDTFDQQTGLNNFADGALALCPEKKTDSKHWKSLLTMNKLKELPCVKKMLAEQKKLDDKILPSSKRQQPLPILQKENQPNINVNNVRLKPEIGALKREINQPRNGNQPNITSQSRDPVLNMYGNQSRNGNQPNITAQSRDPVLSLHGNQSRNSYQSNNTTQSRDPVLNLHGNQSRNGNQSNNTTQSRDPVLNLHGNQSRNGNQSNNTTQSRDPVLDMYGNQSRNQTSVPREDCRQPNVPTRREGFENVHNPRPYNSKPLFSSGEKNVPWSDQQHRKTSEREAPKRPFQQVYGSEEDENDQPRRGFNAFRTARQQLDIDKQKKFGGGGGSGGQSRGSVQPAVYGTGKKSLGTRRGLNSKFVPPIANREDEDIGNQAATIITRAVMKTGGGGASGQGEGPEMEGPLKGVEPKMVELIMNEIMDNGPQMTWDDVAGLEFAKKTIKEIVVWPMLRPDIFTGLRGPPKGLLLFGPPGTGKTLIGKCIASQSKSTFFCISASSLTSKWVGEGEKMVRALFAVSRAHQPAVVFIDEIDSLLTQRTDGENEASRRIKTEFLVQLDGASTNSEDRLLVIGATNRPQEIDEAARRRFVKRLYIPLPEQDARCTIVTNLLKQQSCQLSADDLEYICTHTHGFSGADMATLCREAALGPIRDMSFGDIEHIAADQVRPIIFKDFKDALENVRPSVSEKDLDLYLDWNKTYGSGGR